MTLKILHIAPFNIAGVPITFVRAERQLGFYSRLITLGHDPRNYEEDICLRLPFMNSSFTFIAKKFFSPAERLNVDNRLKRPEKIPPTWQPHGAPERLLIKIREILWQKKIRRVMEQINFWNFDVYQLDGGLEFYRDGRLVKQLKRNGKKVICCYTGSDLRTRGVIPEIDALSDLNVTTEFDHIKLHPRIHHVFFPFDLSKIHRRPEPDDSIIKIGHAPTNRSAKGSDKIIAAIQELQQNLPVQMILIENLPHAEALRRKAECHIFVDQIGELGYGINSLEALAMGIPTCSCLAPGFARQYPDHPFVVINEHNIKAKLMELVHNKVLRKEKSRLGRDWVARYHDAIRVVQKIHKLAGITQPSAIASTE